MKFNEAWFDRHLEGMGQRVLWYRAYTCACANVQTGSADPKCTLCRGKGRIYDAPVEASCAPASQKTQSEWAKLGNFVNGDLVITIPAASVMWERAGQNDRVTMLNATDKFSAILTRGGAVDELLFKPVSIQRVFWRGRSGQLVEGGIPVVDDQGRLSWPKGGEPPPGTTYSVTGLRRPEYHLFDDFPASRNMHQGARLPKRVVIRKYDLAAR